MHIVLGREYPSYSVYHIQKHLEPTKCLAFGQYAPGGNRKDDLFMRALVILLTGRLAYVEPVLDAHLSGTVPIQWSRSPALEYRATTPM